MDTNQPEQKPKDQPRKRRDRRKGLPVAKRPIVEAKTANQYIRNPRQERFLDYYLEVNSPTFGNAYKSALEAGYSEEYAREISRPSNATQWLADNPRVRQLQPEHIELMIQDIAANRAEKTADRIKALELSAKLKGMLIERKQVQTEVITISLGSLDNSYSKPKTNIIDA